MRFGFRAGARISSEFADPEAVVFHRLRELLPPQVYLSATAESCGASDLLPAEREYLVGMAPARAAQFAAGRYCARRALTALGIRDTPVGRDRDRAPCWPNGVIGSVSHSAGWAVAVVARRDGVSGLGIDLEQCGRVRRHLWRTVFRSEEIACLNEWSGDEQRSKATALFAAKEAYFKFQYPIWRQSPDFTDVVVRIADAEVLSVTPARVEQAASGVYAAADGLAVVCLFRGGSPGKFRPE